jgi:hypothetical protein
MAEPMGPNGARSPEAGWWDGATPGNADVKNTNVFSNILDKSHKMDDRARRDLIDNVPAAAIAAPIARQQE